MYLNQKLFFIQFVFNNILNKLCQYRLSAKISMQRNAIVDKLTRTTCPLLKRITTEYLACRRGSYAVPACGSPFVIK